MSFLRCLVCSTLLLPLGSLAAVRSVGPVACAYTDLASAVAAADPGDTIRIHRDHVEPTNVRIEKSLTLVGGLANCFVSTPEPGIRSLLASASPASARVLDVRGAGVVVSLINLRLTGAANQGGLNVQNGALVEVAGLLIDGNSALLGGGVWVHAGGQVVVADASPDPTLPGLVVSENQATQGGGVYIGNGSALMSLPLSLPVSIENNEALNLGGNTGRGGGLYLQAGGCAELPGSAFGNTAREGGGAWVQGRAAGQSLLCDIDLMVRDSLHLNGASQGGGLFVAASEQATVVAAGITQNHAGIAGGGLYMGAGADVAVGELSRNTSAGTGGGAAQAGGLLRVRQALSDNQASGDGGGMHSTGGDRHFDGGIGIERNESTAGRGGALFIQSMGETRIPGDEDDAGGCSAATPCRILQNQAAADGGALLLVGGRLKVLVDARGDDHALQVEDNLSNGSGGAIYATGSSIGVTSFGSGLLKSSRWLGNGSAGSGGAIALVDASLSLGNAEFGGPGRGNSATRGGAIFVIGRDATAEYDLRASALRFAHNLAAEEGGAVWAGAGARISLDSTKCGSGELPAEQYCAHLSANSAPQGSALYLDGGSLLLRQVAVLGNLGALTQSGAMVLDGADVDSQMESVLVADNAGSGVVLRDTAETGSSLGLVASTISANASDGMRLESRPSISVVLQQSIIWGDSGAAIFGLAGGAQVSAECSLLQGINLPGSIDANPLFHTSARGAYRLQKGSPAIDVCAEGPLRDLDAALRSVPADMGAFEFLPLPDALFDNGFEQP